MPSNNSKYTPEIREQCHRKLERKRDRLPDAVRQRCGTDRANLYSYCLRESEQ